MNLKNSLYCLLQTPSVWYNKLKDKFIRNGFKIYELEPYLFYGNNLVLLVYVDDLLIFGPQKEEIDR